MRIYALYKPYKLVTRILVVLFGLVCVSNLTLVVLLQLVRFEESLRIDGSADRCFVTATQVLS
jgi:hypothetical protein